MPPLAQQRCLRHDLREAVCRCPGCSRYFCRECVVEHSGRLLCLDCLSDASEPKTASSSLSAVARFALPIASLLVAWLFFYAAGWVVSSGTAPLHQPVEWPR